MVADSIRESDDGLNGHHKVSVGLLPKPGDRVYRHGESEAVDAVWLRLRRGGDDCFGASRRVMEEMELTDDISRGVTKVIASVATRLCGKRSAGNKARKELEALREPTEGLLSNDAGE